MKKTSCGRGSPSHAVNGSARLRAVCNLAAWGTGTRSGSSSASARRSGSPRPVRCGARSRGSSSRLRRRGRDRARLRPVGRGRRRCGRRGLRRARLGAARPRHAAARRHTRRHRAAARARLARRRGARVRPRARVPRGCRRAGARRAAAVARAGAPRRAPIACQGLTPRSEAEAGRPRHRRRADAVGVRGGRHTRASLPRRARRVPPRGVDVPVADAGVPQLDRDRLASRRSLHPAPRLVASRRAAARRVRLVVRRGPRRRAHALAARHDRRPERAAPLARRRDRLRDARGRRPDDGRDQHHLLPRPHAASADDPRRARGVRTEAVLLVLALRERPHRCADRRAQPRARLDRRVRRVGRPLARHARRLRPARLLPARLRLRLARRGPGRRARGARAQRTPRSARCSTRPAGRTRSSSATP